MEEITEEKRLIELRITMEMEELGKEGKGDHAEVLQIRREDE
jgi:hypothetical protein